MVCILFPMGSCLIYYFSMLCRMAYMVSMLFLEVSMEFPLISILCLMAYLLCPTLLCTLFMVFPMGPMSCDMVYMLFSVGSTVCPMGPPLISLLSMACPMGSPPILSYAFTGTAYGLSHGRMVSMMFLMACIPFNYYGLLAFPLGSKVVSYGSYGISNCLYSMSHGFSYRFYDVSHD